MNCSVFGFVRTFVVVLPVLVSTIPLLSQAQAPHITQQPQSQTALASTTVTFTVAATGKAPLAYYWSFNGHTLNDGGRVSGARTATLTLANILVADAGTYQVVVSNRQGTAVSAPATLTVLEPPTLTSQPQDHVALLGDNASFGASATGTPPMAYQWFFENAPLANDGRIRGATTPVLTLLNLQANQTGHYWLRVTNIAGAATSRVAHLEVLVPPTILTPPQNQRVAQANPALFTVEAAGSPPLLYQWYFNGTAKAGATSSSYWIAAVQPTNAGSYSVLVSNSAGYVTSPAAVLDVVLPAAITVPPVDMAVPPGATAWFNARVTGSPQLAYRWQKDGVNLVDGGRVSGCFTTNLVITGAQVADIGAYRLVVTNLAGMAVSPEARLALVPLAAWGLSQQGLTDLPVPGTNAIAISTRHSHNLILRADGTAVGWGFNYYGQATVPAAATNLVAVAAGVDHSLGLRADGTVLAWGTTSSGALAVPAEATNVVAIAAGNCQNLALRADGSVVAWGANSYGQSTVPAEATNLVAIAAGWYHNLALRADGTVVAWGGDFEGQATVPTEATNVVAIAAGGYYSLALRADGTVAGWGQENGYHPIPADATNLVAIAAGMYHNLGLRADGSLMGWGNNIYGELDIPAGATNPLAIGAGTHHSLVLLREPAVLTPPKLWQQPFQRLAAGGEDVVFAAAASGSLPLQYQWLFQGAPLLGQTKSWLGLTNISPDHAGLYQLRVANAFGSVTGTVAHLAVEGAVRILSQPTDQVAVLHGTTSFTAAVAGTRPLALQWLKNGVPLTDNDRIRGVTTTSLIITDAQAGDAGQYSLSVSNAYSHIVSAPATLSILFPPEIVTQPAGQTTFAGSNVTFAVAVTGTEPLGYQWYRNGNPLADNSRIAGATTPSLTLSNAQPADGGDYSVTVTNAAGFALSAPATLTVIEPARILAQPASRSVALGFPVGFSVSATGTEPLAYQWQLNGVFIPGATNLAWYITAAGPADFGDYRVLVTNPAGTVASLSATLTLSPVAAWARNSVGQTVLPAGLSNVVAIAAGPNHSLALRADGTVTAWGDNSYGQISVPPTLSNVVDIAAGSYHNLALRADGTVVGWGANSSGQTNVPSTLSNVVAIAAGTYHSLALRNDGTVVGWGSSGSGQLLQPAGLRNVVAIAAGTYSSLALRADGTVAYWGTSNYGQNQVPAGLTNAVAVAAGYDHCLALRADGTVVAWGYNYYAQTNVPAGLTNAVAIAAGKSYSLALRADGTLATWGSNSYGQTNVPAILTNLVAIAAGDGHNLGLVSDGRPVLLRQPVGGASFTGRALVLQARAVGAAPLAYQWLRNGVEIEGATEATLRLPSLVLADQGSYQVRVTNALGSVLSVPAPVTVRDGVAPFLISGLPLRQTNNLSSRLVLGASIGGSGPLSYQWRFNNQDLPGATDAELVLDPLRLADAGTYTLAASNTFGSLLTPTDTLQVLEVRIWGAGRSYSTPPTTALSATNVVTVACGLSQYAALRADGVVVTWAQKDGSYPPGYGSLAMSNAIAIASGDAHFLALRRDRTVVSWFPFGSYYYNYGQTNVPAGLANVVGVAGGASHSLALRGDGTVVVWGYNNFGLTNVPATASNVVAIAAGPFHNLALRADGTIVGWGQNDYGKAAGPITGNSNFVAIAAGYQHNLALRPNGTVVAWGYNSLGQLNVPAGLSNVVAIAAGTYHSAALRTDGTVVAWGSYYDQGPAVISPADLAYVGQIAAGGDNGMALFGTRAPSVTLQPWSRSVYPESNLTFFAKAAGVQPLHYQWLFNGAPIPGATTDALSLTNVQFADSGAYQLLVTNVYGSASSLSAKLMVTLPLAQALDTTNLAWTSTGSAPWYGQAAVSRDGVDAARSGAVGNSQAAVLQTAVTGPGTITWWWKVSSEEDFDILEFKIGGVTQATVSGEVGWEQRSFPVPAGPQTFQWRYAKDATLTDGLDAAWVDQVVFIPAPPVLLHQPSSLTVNAGASVYWYVTATGTPPFSYQWLKEGSALLGATGNSLSLTNATRRTGGIYAVQVSNAGGGALSSNAVLKVLVPQRLGSPQILPGGALLLTSGDIDGGELTPADLANFEAQASTNLVNWVPLPGSLTVTNGLLQLLDPDAVNHPSRFYRLVEQ